MLTCMCCSRQFLGTFVLKKGGKDYFARSYNFPPLIYLPSNFSLGIERHNVLGQRLHGLLTISYR